MPRPKVRNIAAGIKDQGPRNFLVTGNGWGIFSARSHMTSSGKPKVKYPNKEQAERAADAMRIKHGGDFEGYKCIFCDGHHVGRNQP